MADRVPLTAAHHAAMRDLDITTSDIRDALDAGDDPDAILAIVDALLRTYGRDIRIANYLDPNMSLLAHLDLPRVSALIETRCETGLVAGYLGDGSLAVADAVTAIDAGIDPLDTMMWTATGRPVSDLVAAHAAVPDVNPGILARTLLAGITPSELVWLADNGQPFTDMSLQGVLGTRGDNPHLNAVLTRTDGPARPLLLLLLSLRDFTLPAASALVTSLNDAPWIDTLTRFVLDGTPVDEAITLARADHAVEQQRAVTLTRAGAPPVTRTP